MPAHCLEAACVPAMVKSSQAKHVSVDSHRMHCACEHDPPESDSADAGRIQPCQNGQGGRAGGCSPLHTLLGS